MKRRTSLLLFFLALAIGQATAQDSTAVKTWYELSGSEFILSFGDVRSNGQKLDNDPRLSGFLHFNYQLHYDYTPSYGIYSGLSLLNVGFTNHLPLANGDNLLLKQRSYSLGIPLAFKWGNMQKRNYLAAGAYLEYMFQYKQKAYYNDNKTKTDDWFPTQVRPFNSSVFVELHQADGFYLRFKYYLSDFLANKDLSVTVPGTADVVSFRPEKSSLYYVSIGWVFKVRKKQHAKKSDV